MSQRLIMYRPLMTNKLTQKFGINRACKYSNGRIVAKRGGACPAGSVDFYKSMGMKGHNGLDFSAWHGERVFHCATFDGFMSIEKDHQGGIGVNVVSKYPIQLNDGSESFLKLRYWHLKAPIGWDGKEVKFGDTIGLADNTGASSGDHLHFGIKRCDENGRPLEPGNGYYGAFDPLPYMHIAHDAEQTAKLLNVPPVPLSSQEKREMQSQLTASRRLLLLLKEKLARM
jgi:murein DD-endopeptidase MepM/ murein hydrolase activator NlpD